MKFPKLSSRFTSKAAAPAPVGEPASVAEATASAPVEATPPAAAPFEAAPPAEPAVKAARLVEGPRFPGRAPISLEALKRGASAAVLAAMGPAARPVLATVALAACLGLGYGVGAKSRAGAEAALAQRFAEAAAAGERGMAEIGRLSAELKTVKAGVDALKGERERVRTDSGARQAQLIDKVEKAGQDNAARIAKLGEQLDRMEKAQRDPARLQAFTDRLDRIEKTVAAAAGSAAQPAAGDKVAPTVAAAPAPLAAAAPTPPPKPAGAKETEVAATGSLGGDAKAGEGKAGEGKAEAKIDPRKTPLEGYAVRDIDDGYALIETKSGRFVEVAVGGILPGVGKVEAIERRGRQWIVVTAKGYVGERWN